MNRMLATDLHNMRTEFHMFFNNGTWQQMFSPVDNQLFNLYSGAKAMKAAKF